MPFDLPMMARRQGLRRAVTFRPITPTTGQAQDLARIYIAVLEPWSANDILSGYRLTTDALVTDSPADSTAAIAQAEQQSTRLVLEFAAGLRRWAVSLDRWHRTKWAAAVKAATTVDVSMMLSAGEVNETIETFIARNVALVKDVSAQAQGRIAEAVYRGYQERQPAREVAKAIREATGMARDRSIRIASHQVASLSGAMDRERQAEAGITAWRWRSSRKKHARPHHAAREGNIYDAKTRRQLNPDTTVMHGGETIAAGDEPSQPPFCGCRRAAYLAIMSEIGI